MNIQIGSKEWLEARRNLITATDAPVILGVSPFKTPLQLYYDKVNGTVTEQNRAMKRGLDLEDEARNAFEGMTGHFVFPQFRVDAKNSWMAASFDGINDQGIVVEIKCPGKEDHSCAVSGAVPEKYYPQLQHQMHVAEVKKCYYFSYRPGDKKECAIIQVERDSSFQNTMLDKEKEFWDLLQSKTPPSPLERDTQFREDKEWIDLENELYEILILSERESVIRSRMIELCEGRPTRGRHLKFNPIRKKGAVDYSLIPQLNGVDLEKFRKPTTTQWRLDKL